MISDEDLLRDVWDEKSRAIGWGDDGGELQSDREQALDYYKGAMCDLTTLPNRSTDRDMTVSDAVKTALPDLLEIFVGEDALAFRPSNPSDEQQAAQETQYVNHVFFNENQGALILHTMIQDALLSKTGHVTWEWQDPPEPDYEDYEGKSDVEYHAAIMAAKDPTTGKANYILSDAKQDEDGSWSFTITEPRCEGRCVVKNYPPEDVCVSQDAELDGRGTYYGFRTRVRRQELLALGYDADLVAELPAGSNAYTSPINYARDQAGELERGWSGEAASNDLDTVEIVYHYLRRWDEGKWKIFRVVTGGIQGESILHREEVSCVPTAANTWEPIAHRFHGESLADHLIDLQKTKTLILRMVMDSGYLAQNQRYIVAQGGVNENTLNDLVNNIPGGVVRVQDPGCVTPLPPAELGFDAFNALEYMASAAEQRSGVTRSSMGLNPDTLHNTASGMLSMMTAAQRRLRKAAHMMAETGLRALYLGIHDCLRQNASMATEVQLAGSWVPIDPTKWGVRTQMDIFVGVGAGGRDYDVSAYNRLVELQQAAATAQGGPMGPLVNAQCATSALRELTSRMGIKSPERFWPDPRRLSGAASAAEP